MVWAVHTIRGLSGWVTAPTEAAALTKARGWWSHVLWVEPDA